MGRMGKPKIVANTLKELSCDVTSGELWLIGVGHSNKDSIIYFIGILYIFIIKNSITTRKDFLKRSLHFHHSDVREKLVLVLNLLFQFGFP